MPFNNSDNQITANEVGKTKMKAIDLFAGIGGFRYAFEKAYEDSEEELEFVYANEIDQFCCETYETNFGENPMGDITKVDPEEIPEHNMLLAGWPCQSFSIAGYKKGLRDPRGNLFYSIFEILKEKRPEAFLLENVFYLEHHDGGRTFNIITEMLEGELEYDTHPKILNAKYYGVPQNRPRMFIAGFREEADFEFPEGRDPLPKLKGVLEEKVPEKYYISQRYLNGLKKHRKRHEEKGHGFGYEVLDPEGVANALVVGGMGRERNLVKDEVFPPNVYSGGDDLSKPNREGLRTLTPREFARLQGFDDSFEIPVSDAQAYKQFANSIPIPLVRAIAEKMKKPIRKLLGKTKK